MSVRKSSHGTIFLIVSSGSPRALIASSLRSTSKKPFCPTTRSLHPPHDCVRSPSLRGDLARGLFRGAHKLDHVPDNPAHLHRRTRWLYVRVDIENWVLKMKRLIVK